MLNQPNTRSPDGASVRLNLRMAGEERTLLPVITINRYDVAFTATGKETVNITTNEANVDITLAPGTWRCGVTGFMDDFENPLVNGTVNVIVNAGKINTASVTLTLIAIAGEEGEGDLRGIKGLLDDMPGIAGCVSLEPEAAGDITYGAVGSKRYEFVFRGPGGHSWHAFGLPSPLHARGRAIAKMADVRVPAEPRATYTVGVVSGGSSVNSIADEGCCKLDMRSVNAAELAALERTMLEFARQGVEEENAFRASGGGAVTVEAICIGDRPAGSQSEDSRIVQAACAAAKAVGVAPRLLAPSSTNANAPISRGVPAVVVRTGGKSGGIHTLEEWFDPAGSEKGAQHALLLLFALAGLEGETEPLL
ncbi:MAG: M20/M25/M40 family metallo-hydrolase [Deltaproteobacteria bacterium]|nr:M20/M25/M40 family metallo-hydrolase [Deltaproteobacteria bacterium]